MRVHRPVQYLLVATTLATLAACSSSGRQTRNEPDPTATVAVAVRGTPGRWTGRTTTSVWTWTHGTP